VTPTAKTELDVFHIERGSVSELHDVMGATHEVIGLFGNLPRLLGR